ncbi:MAG: hypothetical protein P9X27_03950 [Candidatus Kaelpia aquatica]|nr:hypothetical protein [Candidatus Kaelpia aquatica]
MFSNLRKLVIFILILFQVHILFGTPDFNSNILRRQRDVTFPLLTAEELVAAVDEWSGYDWIPEPNPWRRIGAISTLRGQTIGENEVFKIYRNDSGFMTFYKHLFIKLLDDYCVSSGRYTHPHISPPLATFETDNKKGYYHIYAEGYEGFEWFEDGDAQRLDEWPLFSYHMDLAGFDMHYDLVDDDNADHNVIVAGSILWTRIDFDGRSCPNNSAKTAQFLEEHAQSLQAVLGDDKYRLLELAYRGYGDGDAVTESEMVEFNALLAQYQREALRNYFPDI